MVKPIVTSASEATSNVFNTIGTVAQTMTNTIETASRGLDMLNAFVNVARTKQIARIEMDMETFYERLEIESNIELSTLQLETAEKLSTNTNLKKLFEENSKRFQNITTKLRNPESD